MHIRCPHCHNPVEVVDADPLTDVTCPSCGSNFSLISGETTSYAPGDVRTIGHFELLESVGAGRFGTVWKARDTKLDRTVAVKIPRRGQIEGPEAEMFVREARAAAQVKHPGVVAVHEVGREDGTLYIVSDFIDGCSLKDWLSGRQLTPREAAELCAKIAEALHVAHEAGVVHRDLKPGNVMMDAAGQPRLTDFGLAKREAGEITMTVDGQMLGTPAYMSPEQARGEAHTADRRSDVYSLGVILFELLTGETPFRGNQRMMVVQILQDEPPSPRKLQARIPRDLETICLKCLEKPPGKRYQTAAELAAELGRFLRGEPIVARPIGRTARFWRWCKRQPVVAGLTAAVALTLVTGTLVASIFAISAYTSKKQMHAERDRANENAVTADGKAREALEEKQKTQRQLVLSYLDRGVNEMERGDPLQGYAILGQAYHAASDSPDLRASTRALLGAWNFDLPCVFRHEDSVVDVKFSPCGAKIATASADGTARLWDAATRKPLVAPMRHGARVLAAVFSPDGRKIVTASDDHTARLWDAATGKPLGVPMKHDDAVAGVPFNLDRMKVTGVPFNLEGVRLVGVSFNPDGTKVATANWDRTARLWDATTGKALAVPMKHDDVVVGVSFSPDGTKIATASLDNTARLWDAATGKPLGTPMKHDSWVLAVAFGPDGTSIATASADKTARLWDAATGKPLGAPMKHDNALIAVAFSPDGTTIATGSPYNMARLWDAATGKPLGAPMKRDGAAVAVAFSPDGTKIATASGGHIARLWDAATGKPLGAQIKHLGGVNAVAFSPDGTKIATASGDNTARLWDAAAGKPLGTTTKHETAVFAVAFSPDGTRIATAGLDRTARVWDAVTGKPLGRPMKHDSLVRSVAFSPDGKKIATASYDHTARLWDAATGKPLGTPMKHDSLVRFVAFSPDGKKIATASYDHTARLWDAATCKPLGAPMKHEDIVMGLAFSPDGTKIVTGSQDRTARLWDAATGKPLGAPMKHDGWVLAVAFSPDGTKIATAKDIYTQLWNAATGKPLGEPLMHDDYVSALAFSPDGTKIATASGDHTARLWDAATRKALGGPMKHDDSVYAVAFSTDGTKIATASHDGTARLWAVPRSLREDPAWITAYVQVASGWKEDIDGTLHPLPSDAATANWAEIAKSPTLLEDRNARLDESRRGLHESEAARWEAENNWFAAAFHLRWLCKMEPNNPEWPQRLAKAKEHLASSANVALKPPKAAVKRPDASKLDKPRPETGPGTQGK